MQDFREYHDIIDPRRVIDMTIGLIAHDAKEKTDAEFLYRLQRHLKQTHIVCNRNRRKTDRRGC